ncbi:MAG: hypothetical protein PHG83_01375 [Patescibacteria group bacterium]|nr:hypothetical protein [Patescibacteria group bacterium]
MFSLLMMLVMASPSNLSIQFGLEGGPNFLGVKAVATNNVWGGQTSLTGFPRPDHDVVLWMHRVEAIRILNSEISYIFGGALISEVKGGGENRTGFAITFGAGTKIFNNWSIEVGLGRQVSGENPGAKLVTPYSTYQNCPWIVLGGFYGHFNLF